MADLSWAYFPPNTSFKLVNVTWDMSYRDIVRFKDRAAQKAWFDSLPGQTVSNAQGHRFGAPIRLNIPFNEASQYNYLIAYNDYPDVETPRYWYYFIQSVDFVNLYATQFNIMLDVWQSFQYDVTFGRSYVERGHIGVANSNAWSDYGKKDLTLPEGLDTGAESTVTHQQYKAIAEAASFGIIVVSTVDLSADLGTEDNSHNPTPQGTDFERLPNGVQFIYFQSLAQFSGWMGEMGSYPWATQGIISIYAIPEQLPSVYFRSPITKGGFTGYILEGSVTDSTTDFLDIANFRNAFTLPERYRNLKKFLTYPYSSIELNCLSGQSLILKPELVGDRDLKIYRANEYVQPGGRIKFIPRSYNSNGANSINPTSGMTIDAGEFIDTSIGIDDFPMFAAVNNTGAATIAASAHSLAWSRSSAAWDQNKTMMGVNNAYAQANASTGYASQQTALGNRNRSAMNTIGNNSATTQTAIAQTQANFDYGQQTISDVAGGISGAVGGAASGAATGGAVGAVAGAAGVVAQTGLSLYQHNASYNQANQTRAASLANTLNTNNATTAQSNSYATASTGIGNAQTQQFADMNRTLGTAVASGDYANTIAGINAKVQDMANTPPSQVGNIGGNAFNVTNGIWGLLVRFRQIQPSAMVSIGEFWLRYGYYVQRFIQVPSTLQCMSKFTYWKMHEMYISSSSCPMEFRLTIKGIFEKGVTVWSSPSDIGAIDYADNDPLTGVSY